MNHCKHENFSSEQRSTSSLVDDWNFYKIFGYPPGELTCNDCGVKFYGCEMEEEPCCECEEE